MFYHTKTFLSQHKNPVSGHTLMCFVFLVFLLNVYLYLGNHTPFLNKICFIVIFAKVLPSLVICSSPVHALSQDAIPVPAEKPHSASCVSDKLHSSMSSLFLVAHWSWSPHLSTSKILPSTFSGDSAKKEMLGVTLREVQQLPMQKILPILINKALYKMSTLFSN